VTFNFDDTRVATGGADKSARIWDAADGQQLLELPHDAAVIALAFSPDGTQLATASAEKSAWIWDVATP
jgi:WD40 repeat protein